MRRRNHKRRLIAIALLLFPLLALSCGIASGKPSTSAPGGDSQGDILAACVERQNEIDDWEDAEKMKVEDDFADGKRDLLQAMVKVERIEEEAAKMHQELQDNCDEAVGVMEVGPTRDKGSPISTPTPRH